MLSGKCACGACEYQTDQEPGNMFHCACSDCKAASGVGHSSMILIQKENFKVSGPLKAFEMLGGSGMPTYRNFCENCGTPVFNNLDKYPNIAFIHAGTLEDPELFQPNSIAFEDEALSWDFKKPAG